MVPPGLPKTDAIKNMKDASFLAKTDKWTEGIAIVEDGHAFNPPYYQKNIPRIPVHLSP